MLIILMFVGGSDGAGCGGDCGVMDMAFVPGREQKSREEAAIAAALLARTQSVEGSRHSPIPAYHVSNFRS
jgi:hypothetical protein